MKKVFPFFLLVILTFVISSEIKQIVETSNGKIDTLKASISRLDRDISSLKSNLNENKNAQTVEFNSLKNSVEQISYNNKQLRKLFDNYASYDGQLEVFNRYMMTPTVQIIFDENAGAGVAVRAEQIDHEKTRLYILTALHVIREALDEKKSKEPVIINIYANNKKVPHTAKIVHYNTELDIALLVLTTEIKKVNTAKLLPNKNRNTLTLYEPVVTIGCPLGHDPIATEGRITSFHKRVKEKDFWLMSSPTVYGNSGGGVFLKKTGELIGIANMICTYDGIISTPVYHMSIFLPISDVYDWLDSVNMTHIYSVDVNIALDKKDY